jgi:hypothetical protein
MVSKENKTFSPIIKVFASFISNYYYLSLFMPLPRTDLEGEPFVSQNKENVVDYIR